MKAANVVLTQPAAPEREAVVEAVVRGWAEQRKVRIVYQGLHARQPWNFLVSPYLIEPAVWSDGAYLIGHSDVHGDVAVFKIERILEANLMLQTFTIPESFDESKLLDYAWGIWRGEGEPQPVRLKFQPGDAARRVKETVWHRLESVTDTPDGGCIWSAPIGEWQEMLPWIRGWGSQVEVLEPQELREVLVKEARRLAEVYQLAGAQAGQPAYYAHSRKGVDRADWQLLKDHLFKTADLAERFGQDAGISELARTAALPHDLGKYSKAFQARLDGSPRKVDHATAGARTVME